MTSSDNNNGKKESKQYLGDLNKTAILTDLVKTPKAERDQQWQDTFLENIKEASFRCGAPKVITGPDGFPYFQLFLPEPYTSFECYVIKKMKDDFLLQSGYGVVINPTPNSAEWVLTYGDILNLHVNDTFYTEEETPFSKASSDESTAEDEQVMIGQPSEAMLPQLTRQLIAKFLKMNGVETPKVLLMMRHKKDGKGVAQNIVFNILPSQFANENTYNTLMRTISWFLPSHYSFVGMDEKSLGDNFISL